MDLSGTRLNADWFVSDGYEHSAADDPTDGSTTQNSWCGAGVSSGVAYGALLLTLFRKMPEFFENHLCKLGRCFASERNIADRG